jgi:hypothetical protein
MRTLSEENEMEVLPYGIDYYHPGMLRDNADILHHLIRQDHGLSSSKKKSLLTMLNSPDVLDHMLAGAAGMAVTHVAAKYMKLSPPARTLLSLAGFGIGNILYNTVHTNKHTLFDPHTGISKVII